MLSFSMRMPKVKLVIQGQALWLQRISRKTLIGKASKSTPSVCKMRFLILVIELGLAKLPIAHSNLFDLRAFSIFDLDKQSIE